MAALHRGRAGTPPLSRWYRQPVLGDDAEVVNVLVGGSTGSVRRARNRPSIRSRRGSPDSGSLDALQRRRRERARRPGPGPAAAAERSAQPSIHAANRTEASRPSLSVGQQQALTGLSREGPLQLTWRSRQSIRLRASAARTSAVCARRSRHRPPVQSPVTSTRACTAADNAPCDQGYSGVRNGGHGGHVARLYPQVEFLAHGGRTGGQPGRADRPAPARAALQTGASRPVISDPCPRLAEIRLLT